MKLVRSEDLRLRLGFGNVDTLVAACDNACHEATFALESDLRTPLLRATYQDIWLVTKADRFSERVLLKLTAGFVQPGIEVGTGKTIADAHADSKLTEGCVIDLEKGTVLLTDNLVYVDSYVSVRYTAGFEAAAAPKDDEFKLDTLPDWLAKAAEMKAIELVSGSPELDNKEGKVVDGKTYARQYLGMVERKVRYVPDSRLPTA